MEIKTTVTSIDLSKGDLVNLLSTATYGDATFSIWVDDDCKEMKGAEDECLEEKWANVLLAGGHLCVGVMEAGEGKREDVFNESKFYKDEECFIEEFDGHFPNESLFVPYYKVTLDRIKGAFKEILEKNCYPKDHFNNLFVEECGDFIDAWCLLQYIVFGEVIYG